MTQLEVAVFQCNSCGRRYPLAIYYPAAAPHGPDMDCRAELGWTMVSEPFPPVTNEPTPYPG